MRLVRAFAVLVPPAEALGETFARVSRVLLGCGLSDCAVRFRLVDRPSGRRRVAPALRRALVDCPALAPFAWTVPDQADGPRHVLSNLDDTWAEPNPQGAHGELSPARLAALARGIPARFAFTEAAFIFEHLPPLDPWQLGPIPAPRAPGLVHDGGLHLLLPASAAPALRRPLLRVGLLLPTPDADAETVEPPPAETRRWLSAFGRIDHAALLTLPDPAEQAAWRQRRARVEVIVRRHRGSAALAGGPSGRPTTLGAITNAEGVLRAALAGALGRLGFHLLARGCRLRQATIGGAVLELAGAPLAGGAWSLVLRLCHPALADPLAIPLGGCDHLTVAGANAAALAQVAAAVAAAVDGCVAAVIAALGPAPRWFSAAHVDDG